MHTIITAEIAESGLQEEYQVETRGDLKYMPKGAQVVRAIFGCFERTQNGTLLYSSVIEREADGTICHNPDSEYLDDYNALKSGRVEIVY